MSTEAAHPADSPAADFDPLAGLTEPQREAVMHTEGPLLVLAGPGSGKTRVITRRIAYLISCGIPAWQILALTFTNKAAAEMRERVQHMLGEGAASRGLTVTTFHSLCARLLRKYAPVAGLPGLSAGFTIYDTADQTDLMKKVINALNISTSNFPPRSVLSAISAAKNELLDAQAYAMQAGDFYSRTIAKVYEAYQKGLRAADAVDFDDLLVLTAKMLRESREVREACRGRWQYLLVDEYQDTNKAQFVIASLLAGAVGSTALRAVPESAEPGSESGATGRPNICVVGDPDQSIYAWRGADISNILQFEEVYAGARVIALGENFRSTRRIIAAADTLIKNNTERKAKDLFTANAEGEQIEAVACRDEHHEASVVADWIRQRKESGEAAAWKDFAVFYRTNALSRVMEDELRSRGIPYIIARGTAFYQREEVKNAIAYLRVVANPADDVSLSRIINTPARGIGDTTLARIETAAAAHGVPIIEALTEIESFVPELAPRTRGAVLKFTQMLDMWRDSGNFLGEKVAAGEGRLPELVERVIRESGLEAAYKAGAAKNESEQDRLENLRELVSSARDFEEEFDPTGDPAADLPLTEGGGGPLEIDAPTPPLLAMLRAYLEKVTLVADADMVDPSMGAVTLMTLHAAKGLEFPCVSIIGLEENVLPHSRAQVNPADLEEERRLFFVGITRAMRRLLVTCARYRTVRGVSERTIPSRFLEELPREHVAFSDLGEFHEPGWDEDAYERPSQEAVRRSVGGGGPGSDLSADDLVRHPQFGVGRIQSISGRGGPNAKAQIRFRDVGLKTLVLQFARLERVE